MVERPSSSWYRIFISMPSNSVGRQGIEEAATKVERSSGGLTGTGLFMASSPKSVAAPIRQCSRDGAKRNPGQSGHRPACCLREVFCLPEICFSSWPGLSRPSMSFLLLECEDVDARYKAGHDEQVAQSAGSNPLRYCPPKPAFGRRRMRRSNPRPLCRAMDGFAEPVIRRSPTAFGQLPDDV